MGPATESDDVLRDMLLAGMNVARLNFSHGSHEYHRQNIERVRRIAAELHKTVAILTDTKGPEIRTRANEDERPILVETGDEVLITTDNVKSTTSRIALDYEPLPHEVAPGDIIFIDDGLIGFEVLRVEGNDIACVVTNGGYVGQRKGVNIPTVNVGLPSVTEQDHEDIRFSCEMGVDAIAASFVRDAQAVREIRAICEEHGGKNIQIFSKVESAFAVEHLDEILAESDGIMVARGDLGIEIPPAIVPQVQRRIIQQCNQTYRPVITATQMLESMTRNPRPTRAEVTDVANAIEEGTDCVMLSGETAAGAYPVEAVRTMAEICRTTEAHLPERLLYHERKGGANVSGATGYAAVTTARHVNAKALLCPTLSGKTAHIMATFRPHLPIIAAAPTEQMLRRTCFSWGVEAILSPERENATTISYSAMRSAKSVGLLQSGDIIVITAGDPISSPIEHGVGITSHTPTNIMIVAEAL